MFTHPALHTLLNLDIPAGFPGVVVYTRQPSERLVYVCGFIFKHVMKLNFQITGEKEKLKNEDGIKINYSEEKIPGVFSVVPDRLLFDTGVPETKPQAFYANDIIYFYKNAEGNEGNLNYDIFSAVFYFISRSEEWQNFLPDKHQRFEAAAATLFSGKHHLKPVVDLWILEFAEALKNVYPGLRLPERKLQVLSTIDVDNLYAYKSKGLLRTTGAFVKDFLKGDFLNLKERYLVLSGKKKDPFDVYDNVSEFCFQNKIPLICFFLFRNGTQYDRTVNPNSPAFSKVFKVLRQKHAYIGVHPSYNASVNKKLLQEEIEQLTNKAAQPVYFSRQHYLRFNIRTTPKELMANGIIADFSMGFASEQGFRAGTSYPFYYYDFEKEKAETLLFIPFCTMDGVYTVYKNASPDLAYKEMTELAREVKKTGGLFITVFHERTFSDHLYKGFGTLYKKLHSGLKGE